MVRRSDFLTYCARVRICIVACGLSGFIAPITIAQDAQSPQAMPSWQTPEGVAYEAARLDTGRAYIECLLATLRDDDELAASEARQECVTEGQQYAKYLPAEKVDEILQRTAFEVKAVESAR